MRALFLSALLGASVSFASFAVQANEVSSPSAQRWQGLGVVQSFSAQSVMLRHDAIPELKWPAMTMPFTLSAGAVLNGAKPGDEVTFTLERAGDGFQIVSLTPQR
ncbi:copper-binding protein [Enterobacter mori]|uniref:Copper-binding protein n=1 Tax=Enterobacter mori TaxID=539813 RepID=A0A7T0DY88_9ENTR|nr:copper-binding protein [Enterobacter mori]QPK01679.1 copper-binding protein [Enterobacter mori]